MATLVKADRWIGSLALFPLTSQQFVKNKSQPGAKNRQKLARPALSRYFSE